MLTEALREVLEQQLACRCGAMNSPYVRPIRLERSGEAACEQCGHGGPVQDFLHKEP